MEDSSLNLNFIISLIVSLLTAFVFACLQWGFYSSTKRSLKQFQNFFSKKGKYDIEEGENYDSDASKKSSKVLKNVADNSAELHGLIIDINDYLRSCKGTATFNIIQNKTERRITKLYDKTTSKSSFPTHFGLMGTFVGVFLGLGAFLILSINSIEGITDDAIHSLIMGVLVSMSTSFFGLILSTISNYRISNAKNRIDDDKNEFYEFVQNKLMPSVDISLTEALGNLHQTVSDFEPSFTTVISGFKSTFQECTNAFGADFRKSVQNMVDAVGLMSGNVNKITSNVELLEDLLGRLSGAEWMNYMRQFANASDHFKTLTQSLNDFERARRMMLAATQEAINIQRTYNESLTIPREVATEINTILQRVVRFEESINALGKDLAATQMFGNTAIEEIKNQISAIKVKHKVAEQYIETSNNKLEMFFDSQLIELKRLETKYQEALVALFEAYEKITDDHKEEINQRHEIFKNTIDDKFELSEVRSELVNLKKIPDIVTKVDDVKRGQEKLQRTNDGIRSELNAFNAAKEEEKKGLAGKILGGGNNSAKDREIEQQKKENEALQRIIDQAMKEKEEQRKFEDFMKQREKSVTEQKQNIPGNNTGSNDVSSNPVHEGNEGETNGSSGKEEQNSFIGKIGKFFGRKK